MDQKLLKPADFAERQIVDGILTKRFAQGDTLPAERVLAQQLGVTRPTLREALQRLSKEGWVTIQHGKATKVNHYLRDGGLTILSALVRHKSGLTRAMIGHLLEVRTTMMPDIAQKAVEQDRLKVNAFLKTSGTLSDNAKQFSDYDWKLQTLMIQLTGNPVFNMIFNDFRPLYEVLGEAYFKFEEARRLSAAYYEDLRRALETGQQDITAIVETALKQTQALWEQA